VERKKKEWISREDALKKLMKYCAYQDRCHQEVRTKLLDLGMYGDDLEEIITELIQENFLNEERFARSYARGKFRMKKWGRQRIRRELKARNISDYCMRKAMQEIDPMDYEQALEQTIQQRSERETESHPFKRRGKIAQYVISRGYEPELVWAKVKELI